MADPVRYDPQVIVTFAERLYRRARSIVISYGVAGFFAGLIFGPLLSGSLNISYGLRALLFAGAGAIGGVVFARNKAFALRLLAQQALCQMEIEKNTRPR